MTHTIHFRVGLTGGSSGELNNINGNSLHDKDMSIAYESGEVSFYHLDEFSGSQESPPYVIPPILNSGEKRWLLCDLVIGNLKHYGEVKQKYSGVQSLIGAGEIDTAIPVTEFQATGADILTIGSGEQNRIKYVCMVSGGDDGHFGILSGENFAGDNLLFAHNGDSAALLFTSGKWRYLDMSIHSGEV